MTEENTSITVEGFTVEADWTNRLSYDRAGPMKASVDLKLGYQRLTIPITGMRLESLLDTMQDLAFDELRATSTRDDDALLGNDNRKMPPTEDELEMERIIAAAVERRLAELVPQPPVPSTEE